MEDIQIIKMFWLRNENAIQEIKLKYGRLLYSIAYNILSSHEDSEECVSDTYYKAWNSIPPHKPNSLVAFLGRIIRNQSIDLWYKNHAKKRYNGAEILISELSECIPSPNDVEGEIESKELSEFISEWLYTLSQENRVLFVRRYWFGESLNALASEHGIASNRLAQQMYRMRQILKNEMEKEGIIL